MCDSYTADGMLASTKTVDARAHLPEHLDLGEGMRLAWRYEAWPEVVACKASLGQQVTGEIFCDVRPDADQRALVAAMSRYAGYKALNLPPLMLATDTEQVAYTWDMADRVWRAQP